MCSLRRGISSVHSAVEQKERWGCAQESICRRDIGFGASDLAWSNRTATDAALLS